MKKPTKIKKPFIVLLCFLALLLFIAGYMIATSNPLYKRQGFENHVDRLNRLAEMALNDELRLKSDNTGLVESTPETSFPIHSYFLPFSSRKYTADCLVYRYQTDDGDIRLIFVQSYCILGDHVSESYIYSQNGWEEPYVRDDISYEHWYFLEFSP